MNASLRVFRGHGLGNDYLVVDSGALGGLDPARAVVILADRNRGLGGDGLLVVNSSAEADFGLRIFNPDGSEAEKSGNGLRILALFLLRLERVRRGESFTVETAGGRVSVQSLDGDGPEVQVAVEMGRASFGNAEVGFAGEGQAVDVGGRELSFIPVSMGNPHAVVMQEHLEVDTFRALAPRIAAHRDFATGVNVQFVAPAEGNVLDAFVWERGAGETLASGSSACAVAAAAVRTGLLDPGEVVVRMPGGTLRVRVGEDWELHLTGPAEGIGWIDLDDDLARRLRQAAGEQRVTSARAPAASRPRPGR